MKKILLFIGALMFCPIVWAGYGILVNGCDYYAAEAAGEYEGFQQYLAKVQINNGDYCQLYDDQNKAAWMCTLNQYSVKGFTKNGNQLDCSVAGKYEFYIKMKYQQDELYVGAGTTATTPTNLCPSTGFYVAGNGVKGSSWCCGLSWDAAGCPMDSTNSIMFENIPAGSYAFQVTNGTWDKHWGGAYVDAATSTTGYVTDLDGNVAFKTADTSSVTISFDGKKIVFVCSAPLQPVYVSSVPSQCTDVLMQGFYWDSYAVSEDTPGTDKYGDTRWKTLLAKSGEIGAYFDLIWLPPSALASGTGYHPKQYSNQSGDWGSRAELQTLIKAFHNSGTKVVADMVINHMDAQGAWCDLSIQNFGEYGIFVPDVSWISQDDEMNWPENKADTLAGECWGLASGPHEDAPWYDGNNEANYGSARDWAHAKTEVQEMCRAYSKWMRTEMGYDGFRYDYCKGLHASHFDDYNKAGEAYISFLELWASNDAMKQAITDAKYNTMVLDFQSKYSWVDELGKWGNYVGRGWGMMADDAWKKYAVVWIDSHDNFLRNDGEFGGEYGKSMLPEKKDRLLQANALMLSMPGVPCVFYPHWYQYGKEIKEMINARHCAGVHSESEVKDEIWDKEGDFNKGYQATIVGKNGFIVLQLGTKATTSSWDSSLKLMASGNGYSMWVKANDPVAPRLVVTPDAYFEDRTVGIDATIVAEGGTMRDMKIYYTIDGSEPTTASSTIASGSTLHFDTTTVLKVMGADGEAIGKVQTYTYTYREPLKRGIQVRFRKPEKWDRVYFYAWQFVPVPGTDSVTSSNLMGAYPGQRIYQDQDGWFTYEFANDLDSINFCINSGNECGELNVRSNDLVTDYDVCYGWQDATDTLNYYEVLLDCETTKIDPDFDIVISPETGYFRSSEEGQQVRINVVGEEGTIYFTKSTDPGKTFQAKNDTTFTVLETTTISAYAQTAGGLTTPEKHEIYMYKEPQMGALTVKFVKPHNWKTLYLYAFTRVKVGAKFKDTAYPLDGNKANAKWPGRKFKATEFEVVGEDSIYSYTMDADLKEIYVIFNIGSNKTQTQDIFLDEDACYNWSDKCWRAVLSPECNSTPVPTPIEEKTKEVTNGSRKFIYHGELLIQVGDEVYDIFGERR